MRRYDCLLALAELCGDGLVVTNLANTATEWRAARPSDGNLYAVGMGMVTPYALGLALALPQRHVVALDGDGGILFDPSVLGTLAQEGARNLTVVVFDNKGYVSTGPLPTVGSQTLGGLSLVQLARAYGLDDAVEVDSIAALRDAFAARPRVIVAHTDTGQGFVGPLDMDLKENKYRFIRHIERLEGRTIVKPSAKEHGAPPPPDAPSAPVTGAADLAEVLHQGLVEAGIDFAVGLPCSGFSAVQGRLMADAGIRYIPVAHEGTGLGLCAGAWLGGRRPVALIENFGVMASVYHLLRGHLSYGIPTLIIAEYRGDTGDQEFFAEGGEVTEDLLRAIRINHRRVDSLPALKPAIRDALRWMDGMLRPFALLPAFELTRKRA